MLLILGHDERVRCVAYSPDGRLLASGGSDWTVRLWDLSTGEPVHVLRGHRRTVLGLAFRPDGAYLASAGNGTFFWEVATGHQSPVATRPAASVMAEVLDRTAFFLEGERPGLSADAYRDAAVAAVWRLLPGETKWMAAELSRLWDAASIEGREIGVETRFFNLGPAGAGRRLAVPANDRGILRGAFVPGGGWGLANHSDVEACFSPDGGSIALTAGHRAWLCRLDGSARLELEGHTDAVRGLAFSPDGETLATAGFDGMVRFWDAADGAGRGAFDPGVGVIDSVAFSPDGMTLAAGGKRGIAVWDAGGGF